MPQLLFRGVDASKLKKIGKPLAEELAAICECGSDNFTMDCQSVIPVYGGLNAEESYPFVEIGWFERGQEIRDLVAMAVTRQLAAIGVTECEIAFKVYREDSYYINGKPCS